MWHRHSWVITYMTDTGFAGNGGSARVRRTVKTVKIRIVRLPDANNLTAFYPLILHRQARLSVAGQRRK